MPLVLAGSTSGQATIQATDAQTVTLTLPATTGTLVVTGGAQTIEFADGSAAAPSITNSGDTNTGMFFPAADTIAFSEGGVEAMRLDASGNLMVGSSSSSVRLKIQASPGDIAQFTNGTDADLAIKLSGGVSTITPSTGTLAFGTNNTERMRIDSSGDLLLGTSSRIFDGKFCIAASLNTRNSIALQNTVNQGAGNQFVFFANSAGAKAGSIDHTGATTVAYTTSSDYRMKENVQRMVDSLDKVLQLKPVTYNWKADGSAGQGFIAHELQAVVPDCVTGEKDAVDEDGNIKPQGIDTSFLVATLTAALQEQQALITQLQADVAALKGAA